MIGEIHDRIFVGGGGVINFQIFALERVAHNRRQRAGKTLISVGANVGEFYAVRNFFSFPHNFVESPGAAVEGVGGLDLGNVVGLTVQTELAPGNAVSIAANQGTEERWVGLGAAGIPVNGIKSQNEVSNFAALVRHLQGLENAAVSDDTGFKSAALQR